MGTLTPPGYLTPPEIYEQMSRLEADHDKICQLNPLIEETYGTSLKKNGVVAEKVDPQPMGYLKIAGGIKGGINQITKEIQESRPRILITAGMHAREWAPPDAVLSFTSGLLRAYDTQQAVYLDSFEQTKIYDGTSTTQPKTIFDDAISKRFQDVSPPVHFPFTCSLSWPDVKRIIEQLILCVVPCVNPDGRAWNLNYVEETMEYNQRKKWTWRKNRRPSSTTTDEYSPCIGVDLNRNFPIAWNFKEYYNMNEVPCWDSAMGWQKLDTNCPAYKDDETFYVNSTNPCEEYNYIGPDAMSEPETKNIVELMDKESINCFVDVHSSGREINYPWSMETIQTLDPTQSFINAAWNGKRDGPHKLGYSEYFPNNEPLKLLSRHKMLAFDMRHAILEGAGSDPVAIKRSDYTVRPSYAMYTMTGAGCDYVFARQITDPTLSPIYSFDIECGDDNEEMQYWPDYVEMFPKIEREVHAALARLLKDCASWSRLWFPKNKA